MRSVGDLTKNFMLFFFQKFGNVQAKLYLHFVSYLQPTCGPGSSVGITTDYGLDGPGSNPGEDEIYRPSRPALGPTQPPVKWVSGLCRG